MSMMVSVITSWLRRWVFVRYENHLHYRERERERERERATDLGFGGILIRGGHLFGLGIR